jgi:CheY-like chemotaxis protein
MTVRILMVDDEPDAQELFRQNFRREIKKGAFKLEFAQSGDDALAMLSRDEPPSIFLVLSDINMPGMSGLELLSEIRRTWPELHVFMITAYGDDRTKSAACELGAERFLTKPLDFGKLKREIHEVSEERV